MTAQIEAIETFPLPDVAPGDVGHSAFPAADVRTGTQAAVARLTDEWPAP
jgi:hypothetical protein